MLLFRITGKTIEPLKPLSATQDDVEVFNLESAAAKSRKTTDYLRGLWIGKWGGTLVEEDINGQVVGDPMRRSKEVKQAALVLNDFQRDELLRVMLYPQLPPQAWEAFKIIAHQRNLSVYCRHLFPEYKSDGGGEPKLLIITTIEAVRLIGRRTGECEGRTKIEWAGEDRQWVDAWDSEAMPPKWARCGVYRRGDREATVAVVEWKSYAPFINTPNGPEIDPYWQRFAASQLGKCAEVAAYRAACPGELEGIYTREEMRQAENFQPKPPPPEKVKVEAAARDDEDSQVEQVVEQEEFEDALAQAVPNESQRPLAMSAYKIKYRALWMAQSPRFYVRVYEDLRKMVRQREAG